VVGVWVREVALRSGHGCEGPEGLVIVAFGFGLVRGHECPRVPGLPGQGLRSDGVPGTVARQVPVVDECVEHCAGFPPVVWGW
jgi:hypothetical protein